MWQCCVRLPAFRCLDTKRSHVFRTMLLYFVADARYFLVVLVSEIYMMLTASKPKNVKLTEQVFDRLWSCVLHSCTVSF